MQTRLMESLLLTICLCLLLVPGLLLFQQNEYTLIFERVEVVQFNHDYFRSVRSHNFKYNRTYTAVNLTFDILKDADPNVEMVIEVQAYKHYSNEYRLFPLRFMFDYCRSLACNDFGLKRLLNCGNFSGCPLKRSVATMCNFSPDGHRFPPFIPSGSYKLDLKMFYGSVEIFFLQGYGTTKYPACKGCPVT